MVDPLATQEPPSTAHLAQRNAAALRAARQLLQQRQWGKAVAVYRRLIMRIPTDALLWSDLGLALWHWAQGSVPGDTRPLQGSGAGGSDRAPAAARRLREARRCMARALALEPDSSEISRNIAAMG